MKKVFILMAVLGWLYGDSYKKFIPIVMDDTVSIVMQCQKRPPIKGGTELEKFFNLKLLRVGDSWYWNGCNFQKTSKRCGYKRMENGDTSIVGMPPSKLSYHYTLDIDPDEGEIAINCSLENNYNLGQGFNYYNDYHIILVETMTLYGAADYVGGGNSWWLITPGEELKKNNYPIEW
jgi:hypothetical protein